MCKGSTGHRSAVDLLPLGPVTGGLTDSPRLKYQLVSFGPKPYRLTLLTGTAGFIARASEAALSIPLRFSVEPNAPNPFLRATRIRFGTPTAARVSAEVYSVSGQRVATLLDSAEFAGGYHSVVWDGTAYGGRRAASGVYLLRLSAGGEIRTLHLVLVR